MELRIRSASGAVMLLTGLPVMAQPASSTQGSTSIILASQPTANATVSGEPTWLIVGIAFVVGVGVGYALAKMRDAQK